MTYRDDIIKLAREHEAGVSHYATGTKPGAYIEFHEDELEAFFHAERTPTSKPNWENRHEPTEL